MYSKMKRLVQRIGAMAVLLSIALLSPQAAAQSCGALPCSFTGDPVVNSNSNLTSSSQFMISYRDEQHSWQTSDGLTHFLVNTGSGGGRGLQIWTRYVDPTSQVVSWVPGPILNQTSSTYNPANQFAATSTGDGRLTTNPSTGLPRLVVAYTTTLTGTDPSSYTGGNVAYAVIDYNPSTANATQSGWQVNNSFVGISTIYAVPAGYYATNPTITLDTTLAAVPWVAFTLTQCPYFVPNSGAGNCLPTSTIKLFYLGSVSSSPKWIDTKQQFGPADGNYVSTERSARLVATANAVGMVYQVHQSFFWTYRLNSASLNAAWSAPQAFFSSVPQPSSTLPGTPYDNNPYASHYSVLADTDNPAYVPGGTEAKIHMVTVDHSRLLYFGYGANQNPGWSNPTTLLAANEGPGGVDTGASYPQIFFAPRMNSASGPTQYRYLAAVVNNTSAGNLFQSTDFGQTWSSGAILNHPSLSNTDFSNPRFEVPQAITTADVPLVQQYVDTSGLSNYDNLLLSFDLSGLIN